MKRKQWMLGLFGGLVASVAMPAYSGDVTTQLKGIEIGGELKTRYDYRSPDVYTNAARERDESDDSGRTRASLHARLDAGDGITGLIELRDGWINGATAVGTDDAGVTVHQGYLNIESLFGADVDLMVGRMEVNYGDQRLIGSLDWAVTSRHWDGARFRYNIGEGTWLDIGYAELVNGDAQATAAAGGVGVSTSRLPALSAAQASDPDSDMDLYWAWLQHNVSNGFEVNLYHLWQHDGTRNYAGEKTLHTIGNAPDVVDTREYLDRHTTGALVKFNEGGFKATVEYAKQHGHFGPDDISADLFVGIVGMDLGENSGVEYEFVRGSGDRNDFDGDINGFVSPFPTGHAHLGIADQVGFQNIEAHRLGASHDIDEKTSVSVDHWWFHRQDNNDSWYNSAGTAVRTGQGGLAAAPPLATHPDAAPGGRAGHSAATEIGQELDIVMSHRYSKFLNFSAGYAHFWAGRFAKETNSYTKDMEYFYFQANLKF